MLFYRFARLLCKIVCLILFQLTGRGRRNVDKVKGAIFAVNHTSFFDPVVAGSICPRPLYYLARRSLMELRFLNLVLPKLNVILFNRDEPEISIFKKIIKLLRQGGLVLMFPEGTRSRDGNFLPAKNGVGLLALKAKVPIIPVYVRGAYKVLPRHAKFPRLAKISVIIGEPIYLDTWLAKSRLEKGDFQEVADLVMARIKRLSKQ